MNVQDELNRVADHLEKVGWIQGAGFQDPANYSTSPCCLMGAIEVVSETYVEGQKILNEIHRRIGWNIPVFRWNDWPTQTAQNVVDMLRGEPFKNV